MNEQTTIEKPLLVTLEGAEITVPSSGADTYVMVQVMTYGENSAPFHFPMTLVEYVNLLSNNSLSGIPRNPEYPRFDMVDTSGDPLTIENVNGDILENFGVHLKRTERTA